MEKYGIYVCGLPRSGHTAIMHWLGSQCTPNYDPRLPEVRQCFGSGPTAAYVTMNIIHESRDWTKWLQQRVAEVEHKPVFLVDDQRHDVPPDVVNARYKAMERTFERHWLPPIIVIRDYYNNWASRWQRLQQRRSNATDLKRFPTSWPAYAKEAIEPTIQNVQPVLFNSWVASEDYRQSLSTTLGLRWEDRFHQFMPWPGSSFDREIAEEGQWQVPSSEALLSRWRGIAVDELRKTVTPEIIELNRTLFGLEPPWETERK